jgi:molecular chaperone GrpE
VLAPQNVRAIARRDVEVAKTYAVQSFAKQLLDVVDTLGLALDSVTSEEVAAGPKQFATLHEGVGMTRHTLTKALGLQGVKEVRCPFSVVHMHACSFPCTQED